MSRNRFRPDGPCPVGLNDSGRRAFDWQFPLAGNLEVGVAAAVAGGAARRVVSPVESSH